MHVVLRDNQVGRALLDHVVHPRRVNLILAAQEHPNKNQSRQTAHTVPDLNIRTNTQMIRYERMNRENSNGARAPSLGVGLDSVEVGFPTGSQDVLRNQGRGK